MSYLLDTCVLSKLRKVKKYPDKKLEKWLEKHSESSYFISVITIGEIQRGISKLNRDKNDENIKRIVLEDWLHEDLFSRFNNRILPIDIEVMLSWGTLLGDCQKRGINVPANDGLIAATGIVHNLTVVTENIRDFLQTGARVFNPWIDDE
mgnify:CR=1 FL=1